MIVHSGDELSWGTRVVSLVNGEIAMIMGGITFNPQEGWTAYEVEAILGVQVWRRDEFVLLEEVGD